MILISLDEFITIAPDLPHDNQDRSLDKIGPANSILLSLLIQEIEKKTLDGILKATFEELGMTRTFINTNDIPARERPSSYGVSSNGDRRPYDVEDPYDMIKTIVWGGYSCIADLERFFNSLRTSSKYKGFLDLAAHHTHSPLGLYPQLSSGLPGCLSYPKKASSSGQPLEGVPFILKGQKVHYMAGHHKGWCCAVYFHEFIGLSIVLCNTIGPVDASDFLAQIGFVLCTGVHA